jgi:hypothetical protein
VDLEALKHFNSHVNALPNVSHHHKYNMMMLARGSFMEPFCKRNITYFEELDT